MASVLAVTLSACQDARRALGFEKSAPDEFQVVERAPLSMPPEFAMRPPSPGAVRPQEGNVRDQAKATLLGRRQVTPIQTAGRTEGDVTLLRRAGAEQIQPGVRELVNKETLSLAEADKTLTDKIVFWREPDPLGYKETLNAEGEAQRLRENQALGRALSDGETPKIERRRKGILEGIF